MPHGARKRLDSDLDKVLDRSERLDSRKVNGLLAMLNRARREVAVHIATSDFDIARQQVLIQRIQGTMEQLAAEYSADITQYQRERWADGVELTDDIIGKFGAEVELAGVHLDTTQLRQLQDLTVEQITNLTDEVQGKIATTIQRGMMSNKSPFEVIKEIGKLSGPGIWDSAVTRGEVIYRTEANRVYAASQQARMEQHRPGLRKIWRNSGFNVRPSHQRAQDDYTPGGEIGPIPVDRPFKLHVGSEASKSLPSGTYTAMYPRDPALPAGLAVNCRCVSSPWRDEWEE